jgi:hypothetical protein
MEHRVTRRSALGVLAAGAAVPALARHKDASRPARTTASSVAAKKSPSPSPSPGTGPDVLMIIRHAEKPTGSGTPYGVTATGAQDSHSLIIQGWTRAGALAGLFAPRTSEGLPGSTRPGLTRPAHVLASNGTAGGSNRPMETVTPLAAALGTSLGLTYALGQEAALVTGLSSLSGPVLIAWEHQAIPAIISHLGKVTPKPPKSWPGSRFDMVFVFTRSGSGWDFAQVPQMLLAGDSAKPFS